MEIITRSGLDNRLYFGFLSYHFRYILYLCISVSVSLYLSICFYHEMQLLVKLKLQINFLFLLFPLFFLIFWDFQTICQTYSLSLGACISWIRFSRVQKILQIKLKKWQPVLLLFFFFCKYFPAIIIFLSNYQRSWNLCLLSPIAFKKKKWEKKIRKK